MRRLLTEKRVLIIAGIMIVLAFAFSTYTAYRTFTLKPGQQVVTSGGITVAKPTNGIVDATLRDDGYLVVKFEDGTTKTIGYVVGKQGEKGDSVSQSQAQIAVAVTQYCSDNNRCDAKSPSPEQVAAAVTSYCSARNDCTGQTGAAGTNGTNGQNATAEQVMAAVQTYCSDGRCTGPKGDQGVSGTNGIDGKDPVISCVVRPINNTTRQYVAWKYSTDPDSSYKNLYLLPTWAQGQDCIDLTT